MAPYSSSASTSDGNAFAWQLLQYSASGGGDLRRRQHESASPAVHPHRQHYHHYQQQQGASYHQFQQYYSDTSYYPQNYQFYGGYSKQSYDQQQQQQYWYYPSHATIATTETYGYARHDQIQPTEQAPPPTTSPEDLLPPPPPPPSGPSSSPDRSPQSAVCVTERPGISSTKPTPQQEPPTKKFGRFMGKLLLVKSNRKKPIAANGSSASQNKSLNDYFRTQKEPSTAAKTRATTTATTEDNAQKVLSVSDSNTDGNQHEKPVSQKCINDDANNIEPTTSAVPNNNKNNSHVNSKALPLLASSSSSALPLSLPSPEQQKQQQQHNSTSHDHDDLLLLEDDDLSSLSSLKSEDDVLGPWSEESTPVCTDCEALRDELSGPVKIDWLCHSCKDKWVGQTNTWLGRIAEKKLASDCSAQEKQKRQAATVPAASVTVPRQYKKQRRTIATATTETKKTKTTIKTMKKRKEKKLPPAPPPTKSQTDKYITTGAFMTRNTAKQLADPENGFHPNPYGFTQNQKVEVLNINGHWYRGVLTVMKASKVKISYVDWEGQEEWINMGSRRIRIYSAAADEDEDDDDVDDAEGEIEANVEQEETRKSADTLCSAQEGEVEEVYGDPLLPQISSGARADDYVSATLDKDPQQIFNDNEVFLTRRMARELTDEHGFRANSFGYRYNRAVAVTFKAARGHAKKVEYLGYLREMRTSQVRIWYPTLRQSDWLVVGSRRLRLLTDEEEAALKEQAISSPPQPAEELRPDESAKPTTATETRSFEKSKVIAKEEEATSTGRSVPAVPKIVEAGKSGEELKNVVEPRNEASSQQEEQVAPKQQLRMAESEASVAPPPSAPPKRKRGRPRKYPVPEPLTQHEPPIAQVQHTQKGQKKSAVKAAITKPAQRAENEDEEGNTPPTESLFMTTGAFATRRAMRQLKDEHGFVPNPYGYSYNQPIEILNTRTAKNKRFWERGHLIAMRPGQVKVRYDGWNEIYDEWLMVGSRRIRPISHEEPNSSSSSSTINAAAKDSATTSTETAVTTVDAPTTTTAAAVPLATSSDFMAPEMNPELKDLDKRKRKHQVLGPEDYAQLGYLIPADAPAPPRRGRPPKPKDSVANTADTAPSTTLLDLEQAATESAPSMMSEIEAASASSESEASDYDEDEHHDGNFGQKQRRRRKRQQSAIVTAYKRRKKKQPASILKILAQKHEEELQQQQQQKPISLRRGGGGGLTSADDHGFVANVYGYDYMQHVQVLNLDKKWYEARLVRMDQNRVLIHYCGWIDKYDEYIPLGSRRLQVIENAHEVVCAEPNYKERYEVLLREAKERQQQKGDELDQEEHQQSSTVARRNSRRRTLSERPLDGSGEEIEYHKGDENGPDFEETDAWKVYCNQCNVVIKQFRYYCTYCETPSEGYDYQSFELCLRCFDQNFPFWHDHPRSSFAVQAVINAEIGPMPIKGELVTVWEEDVIDVAPTNSNSNNNNDDGNNIGGDGEGKDDEDNQQIVEEASKVFTGNASIETAEQGYKYLKRWQRRKVCAFCNDDDDTSSELGSFIGPFVIATYNKNGVERKRQFWAHDACARYSPEVFCTPDGKWYNVTLALRRGRGMRCYSCKEKGATIGCFDSRCNKSFHLPCAQKPVSYFRNGVIFWCPTHEAYYNKKDTYVNIFKCDGCNKQMEDESWFTCLPCASGYFSSFDLCAECFEKLPDYNHPHDQDDFEETSFAIIKEMEAEKAREAARTKEISAAKRKKSLFPRRRRKRAGDAPVTTCCYCGTEDAEEWRKGYDGGVIMCRPCFEVALLVDSNDGSGGNNNNNSDDPATAPGDNYDAFGDGGDTYVTLIENYTHKPYLTRDALSSTKFTATAGIRLATYEPQPHQLFSLVFDSTYYDIPGRAPRWASHSGTDYHGTWLPQTVRRAILKHTDKDERVLSNFLGRGTDAIECFLLQRRCCGVDINPAAVALSQRNCCFEIPPGLTSAEYRPIVAQADSRHLTGPLFADESFHHVLSHPPYKDCVAYSTHLDGDLSRFTNIEEFKEEYIKVVHESWRVLKMGRRLTLGIGDNREHCFYIPVGYHLIRQYIDNGFELEELIIKRQRYCSAFGLGTYLCVQFDFLVFTHEFIATFRKIPRENVNRMISLEEGSVDHVRVTRTMRGVPSSAIARKSVVMGTVWVFKPTEHYRFDQLCMSRMVERFGRDDTNWIQIELDFVSSYEFYQSTDNQTQEDESALSQEQEKNKKSDEEETLLSEYEQQRLKRIEENTRTLVQLGLISELSEESTDVMHYENMMSKPPQINDAPLRLMVIAHLPRLLSHHIGIYRQTLIKLAAEAVEKLAPQGMLIIGTQDVRSPDGKLWPMGMLVMEDIERSVDASTLKLKEMIIAVPDGYSKNRHREPKPEDQNIHSTTNGGSTNISDNHEEEEGEELNVDVVDEHLQIVHATYLVFQRL